MAMKEKTNKKRKKRMTIVLTIVAIFVIFILFILLYRNPAYPEAQEIADLAGPAGPVDRQREGGGRSDRARAVRVVFPGVYPDAEKISEHRIAQLRGKGEKQHG